MCRRDKNNIGYGRDLMLAFEILGLGFFALFFAALVTGREQLPGR